MFIFVGAGFFKQAKGLFRVHSFTNPLQPLEIGRIQAGRLFFDGKNESLCEPGGNVPETFSWAKVKLVRLKF